MRIWLRLSVFHNSSISSVKVYKEYLVGVEVDVFFGVSFLGFLPGIQFGWGGYSTCVFLGGLVWDSVGWGIGCSVAVGWCC